MPKKNKEKGVALARQEEDTPTTVNDSTSDISILPQKALENQGNEDAMSENVMENTDVAILEEDGSGSVGGAGQDDTIDEDDENQDFEIISSTAGLKYKGGNVGVVDANDVMRKNIIALSENRPYSIHDLMNETIAEAIKADILDEVNSEIDLENANRPANSKLNRFKKLTEAALIDIIIASNDVKLLKRIDQNNKAAYSIAYYNHVGQNAGIWYSDESDDQDILSTICSNFLVKPSSMKMFTNMLKSHSNMQIIKEHERSYLVPCANGMLNLQNVNTAFSDYVHYTASGFEFTPYLTDTGEENPEYVEKYGDLVYAWKLRTNWNPDAKNVTLICEDGYEWSVDKHFVDAFGDNIKRARLVLEQLNFLVRGLRGNYTIFYGDDSPTSKGGGMKSTTANMLAYILGMGYVLPRDIDDLIDKNFGLSGIVGKKLLLGHETNADNSELKNNKVAKKLMRGNPVSIDQKFKALMEIRFKGMWIQCFNGVFNVAAKERAFYRKLRIIPFPTVVENEDGFQIERDEIQEDFIDRKCVREYLLLKAVSLGAIKGYQPDCLKEAEVGVMDAQIAASTTMRFLEEIMPCIVGNWIPVPALYQAYRFVWCVDNGHAGANSQTFVKDLMSWLQLKKLKEWELLDASKSRRMPVEAKAEPELANYMPENNPWMNEDGKWSAKYVGGSGIIPQPYHGYTLKRTVISMVNGLTVDRQLSMDEALREYSEFLMAWTYQHLDDIRTGVLTEKDCISFNEWSKNGKPEPVLAYGLSSSGFLMKVSEYRPTEVAHADKEDEDSTGKDGAAAS